MRLGSVSLLFAPFDRNSIEGLTRSIVIALKVVAAKTNWREKHMEYEFKTTVLLPNKKYEFKILLVYYLHRKKFQIVLVAT